MIPGNQRRHPRESTNLPAMVEFSWGALEGVIENIGEGGAFFVTDTLEGVVADGDPIAVRLHQGDSGEANEYVGKVLRVERYFHDGELYRSFAIRFDSLHAEGNGS